MKQNRDFHRQVRVVYRACRKLYGKEKTQDECLKIFKVIFPELYRLRQSEDQMASVTPEIRKRIYLIIREWNPKSKLRELIGKAESFIDIPMDCDRLELIKFYEDILPVVMRIRKLTPKECFRLMGVEDSDIDKLTSCGLSNSACYKLAGNSIVVDVMTAIFENLFVNTEQPKEYGTQLSLW